MAYGDVKPGYIGIVKTLGDIENIRCTSFSVAPKQNFLFYNHVVGLRDGNYSEDNGKGPIDEGGDSGNIQRRICRPGTFIASGGMGFSLSKENFDVYQYAKGADSFDLDFVYYCGGGRTFNDCRINTYELSIAAGGEVEINTEISGMSVEDTSTSVNVTAAEKLVTWDNVKVTIDTGVAFTIDSNMLSLFNFRINNNINPIYVSGDPEDTEYQLTPVALRVGMQEVSGTISIYSFGDGGNYIPIDAGLGHITVEISDVGTISTPAIFEVVNPQGSVGPVITTVAFVGVDKLDD